MAKSGMTADLKKMGAAALALMTLAILSVLGIVVLAEFQTSVPNATATVNATITAFVAGLAIFGTFATILALIVVVKAVIGVVKGA